MFTNTLAERITRDLKWEEDEYLDDDGYDGEEEEESIELIHLQNQVFQALIDSIYDALVLYNSFLVKLEEVEVEIGKRKRLGSKRRFTS
jgi:hypothetical protein